jgi:hypothetical protein
MDETLTFDRDQAIGLDEPPAPTKLRIDIAVDRYRSDCPYCGVSYRGRTLIEITRGASAVAETHPNHTPLKPASAGCCRANAAKSKSAGDQICAVGLY